VQPRAVVRRDVPQLGEPRPLPGEVMVMEHGGAAGQRIAHGLGRSEVQRQRADVLGDNEVGVTEGRAYLGGLRWREVVDGEAVDEAVDGALTRHRDDVEAELAERRRPLGGLNRDAVAAAEAVGDEGGDRSRQRAASRPCRRRLVASSTARARASGSLPPRTTADPDTTSSCGGTTKTNVATATSLLPR